MSGGRARTAGGPKGASRSMIVRAAVDLLERVGEHGFSLRKLGAVVGCDAMTITYHFGSKDGLIRAMADGIESEIRVAPNHTNWRARLRHIADQYRSLALRYPQTFSLMQRFTHTGMADYQHSETVHVALQEAGVPVADIPGISLGWYACIIGLAVGEIRGLVAPASPDVAAEIRQLPEETFALTKNLLPQYLDLAPSAVYAEMVEVLLDGIACRTSPRQ